MTAARNVRQGDQVPGAVVLRVQPLSRDRVMLTFGWFSVAACIEHRTLEGGDDVPVIEDVITIYARRYLELDIIPDDERAVLAAALGENLVDMEKRLRDAMGRLK